MSEDCCDISGVMRSFEKTARGGSGSRFALRSRSASTAFKSPNPAGPSLINVGNTGPMTATRGAAGAELEYRVFGGSHRGLFCVKDSKAIATLCLEPFAVEADGGTGRVRI